MKGLLLVYAITAFGAFGSVIRPFYGFVAYVALAMLKPQFLWSHSVGESRYSLIVALAMLASWAMRGFGNWKLGKGRTIVFLLSGFWMWSVFLASFAEHQDLSWYFVEQLGKILLPFLAGVTTIRNIKDLKVLAWTIVVCEGFIAYEMNMYYFSGYNFLWEQGFAGLDNNGAAAAFVASLGVAFFLFINQTSIWSKAFLGACMALMLHAILFSFSRGAMLSTAIGMGISFLIIKKGPQHYALFAIAGFAALMMAGPQVRDRFFQIFADDEGGYEASAQSRLDMWADCWTVIQREPLFGCGPDHWPVVAKNEFGWTNVLEAHSTWVQTAVETGVPGIFMLVGFYLFTIWRCLKLLYSLPANAPPWYGDCCRLVIASLCGFGVSAQFLSLEAVEIPYYIALMGAATLAVYGRDDQESWPALKSDDDQLPLEEDWRNNLADHSLPYPAEEVYGEPVGVLN